jgi:hypothetical protein
MIRDRVTIKLTKLDPAPASVQVAQVIGFLSIECRSGLHSLSLTASYLTVKSSASCQKQSNVFAIGIFMCHKQHMHFASEVQDA